MSNVITLHKSQADILKTFLEEIALVSPGVKPVAFLGIAEDGHAVLHTMPVTWRELSWVKHCWDMHFLEEWMS